ncbi:MAG: phosphatidylinositol-3-phosphatase [Thermoleophilaceae bacterium]|nr:phosphatidylinositol-3-phosphatase [Thermoleophilaceae bacterium]
MRRLFACLLAVAALAAPAAANAAPPIKHVWVIALENKGFDETFGPASPAPYLSKDLPAQGQLLTQYYATAHLSLPNYIALVSGQAPNVVTQADCPFYFNFVPGIAASGGQYIGQGCVYPQQVKTVADQLAGAGLTWKGYMEDMGTPCRHPALNSRDDTQTARANDQYAARHNPFVYFHSIIDSPSCAQNDVPLEQLDSDLAAASSTPSYSFITPDLCHDAHDATCADGGPGGLPAADEFLKTWVPKILNSAAYAEGGLLVVTFDEAENNDATACCGEQPGFNTPNPGGTTPGPGGGRTGAVLISQYVQPGTQNATPYNHYSFLKSTEDIFGLPYLGYAGQAGLQAFGPDVYNAP